MNTPLSSADWIKKAEGCLVGLACGDALGDLGRSPDHRKRYGIATNLTAEARSTDDTEFAVLVARILLDCQGQLTPQAVLQGWQRYILDQGGLFDRGGMPQYGAVENLRRGLTPPLSGQFNVMNIDDGAAMRAAPIGVLCAGDPQRAAAMAAVDAQISHDRDGIWAAQAVAAAVAVAMTGAAIETIVQAAQDQAPDGSWLAYSLQKALQLAEKAQQVEDAWEALHTQLWTPAHSAAPEAIPQALAIFRLTGGDFHKGMFWGCNFGRDADTIGAVIGALCGAIHGIETIPPGWVEKVRRPAGVCLRFAAQEDMLSLAGQLVELAASTSLSMYSTESVRREE